MMKTFQGGKRVVGWIDGSTLNLFCRTVLDSGSVSKRQRKERPLNEMCSLRSVPLVVPQRDWRATEKQIFGPVATTSLMASWGMALTQKFQFPLKS